MTTTVNEVLLGSISGNEHDQIIEVVAIEEKGQSRYEIRLLSFGEGIGWFVQKTLPLDSTQAKALANVLSRTDASFETKLIKQDELPTSKKVINLPFYKS
ncbi:MAG: hypothetical protein ACRENT_04430 [Thermodesulfobacteriota bacterium]